MGSIDDFYRSLEDSAKQVEKEQSEYWLRICKYLLPKVLQRNLENPPAHYDWIDTGNGKTVAWKIVTGWDSDYPSVYLFQDGRLGICYGSSFSGYIGYHELESRKLLSDLTTNLVTTNPVKEAANFHCFLRTHWHESWAVKKRAENIHLLP